MDLQDNTQAHDLVSAKPTSTTHIPPATSTLISDPKRPKNVASTTTSILSSASSARLSERQSDSDTSTGLQCCCGRLHCAYLKHNNAALGDLENNLETAARLGQALLQRHETYVADAEADRARMILEMERLERDRQEMQTANARIVEENRSLLEQLEGLNNAVATSDSDIRALTHRLEQTQLEMRELAASAARAADLELQLNAMEAEQMELQQQLIMTEEDGKSAVQRWKKAETTLRDLQEQLDRLEYDARAEREEHTQIIERMERRRAVERELDGAAGRLKGAAAASAMDRNRNTTTAPVVSKFVRDILQDNANLQMGIVELRELLESSNQEVENLREQILHHHQPLTDTNDNIQPEQHQNTPRLDQELSSKEPRPISQEFHVHHHYHSPTSSTSSKKEKQPTRRSKKRRPSLVPSGIHTPRSSMSSSYHRAQPSSSSTSTIMSQTSVSIPPSQQQRYSVHPSGISSLASSPISAYQPSSIFDIVDQRSEISRPSSPESPAAMTSPKRLLRKRNRMISDASSIRSFSMPPPLHYASEFDHDHDFNINNDNGKSDGLGTGDEGVDVFRDDEVLSPSKNNVVAGEEIWLPPAIPEEQEEAALEMNDTEDVHQFAATEKETHPYADADAEGQDVPGPYIIENELEPIQFSLRKSTSYESLLSVSGMDILTLRDRPSQLLAGYQSRYFYKRPPQVVTAGTELSSTPPVISTTNITADKASIVATGSRTSSHSLLASVAKSVAGLPPQQDAETAATTTPDTDTSNPAPILNKKASTISRKVGGWVMGKWGIAPAPASSSSSSTVDDILRRDQDRQTDTASITSSSSSTPTITTTLSSDTTTTTQSNSRRNKHNTPMIRSIPAMRGFGINQKGPIPGFIPSTSLSASNVAIHVDVNVLDRELLVESLRE